MALMAITRNLSDDETRFMASLQKPSKLIKRTSHVRSQLLRLGIPNKVPTKHTENRRTEKLLYRSHTASSTVRTCRHTQQIYIKSANIMAYNSTLKPLHHTYSQLSQLEKTKWTQLATHKRTQKKRNTS